MAYRDGCDTRKEAVPCGREGRRFLLLPKSLFFAFAAAAGLFLPLPARGEVLSPAEAAVAQDRLMALCYPAEPGEPAGDLNVAPSLVTSASFSSVSSHFASAGVVKRICDTVYAISGDGVRSSLSVGLGGAGEARARPLSAAMAEKAIDVAAPSLRLGTFAALGWGQAAGVGGVKNIPLSRDFSESFEPRDVELLFGPAVARASGSVLDGDLFVGVLRANRRSLVAASLGVGSLSRCLSARLNEKARLGDEPLGTASPVPRSPSSRPVYEVAARSQHDYLIRLRNFLVDVTRTVARGPREAGVITGWLDSLAYGKFIGVAAPSLEVCSDSGERYERWAAAHSLDENLAKLTGFDLAVAARTCDHSPLVRGGLASAASSSSSSWESPVLLDVEAGGGGNGRTRAPAAGGGESEAADSDLEQALAAGSDGVRRLLISRFNTWSAGRYGGGGLPSAGASSSPSPSPSPSPSSVWAAADVGDKVAAAKAALATIFKSKVQTRDAAGGEGGEGGQVGQGARTGAGAGLAEVERRRLSEGRRLFISDWTPPSLPCDAVAESIFGQGCVGKDVSGTAGDAADAAPQPPRPERFISDTIEQLRHSAETYASLYLVMVQEDLATGDFRRRFDSAYVCGPQLEGMDELALRRRRDSAELAALMDSSDLAMSLERAEKQKEMLVAAVAERDFTKMFIFAQKARRAASLEDTRRTRSYLRDGEDHRGHGGSK